MLIRQSLTRAAMPRAFVSFFLLLVAVSPPPTPAAAQAAGAARDSIYELRLGDGTRMYGRVVEAGEDQIVFESITGMRAEVNPAFARLRVAHGRLVDGEFWPEDRNGSRLFFAPTGRTLRTGEGYAGIFLVLPFVGYGVSDNVTIAGGVPLVGSLNQVPVWIAPKVNVYNSRGSQVSTGVFAVYVPGEPSYDYDSYGERQEPASLVGIAYGVGTFGDRDNALHLGTGATFGGEDVEIPVMLGGEIRLSRRNKFLTENWLFPLSGGGVVTAGVRILGQRWTTDLGLATFLWTDGAEEIPYFPIVSFSYAFGGGR